MSRKIGIALFLMVLIGITTTVNAQLATKIGEGKVFGRAYSQFYYTMDDAIKPKVGFQMFAGILGYEYTLNSKVSLGFMYDVTRTTNFKYTDSSGISGYFEGSKYTAYLKMCQIKWNFAPKFSLMFGQLLSTQFLLTQDKWWGMRFIDVTSQEKFGFGMPADFGTALIYQPDSRFKFTASILNGEGPFKYQDENSNFLYLLKAEYKPKEGYQFAGYFDYETITPAAGKADKMVMSVFAGYKINPWMVGAELTYMKNALFTDNLNRKLVSLYSSYKLNQAFNLLARIDYGNLVAIDPEYRYYLIAGLQYTLESNYYMSVNYRQGNYLLNKDIPYIYFNVGLHF